VYFVTKQTEQTRIKQLSANNAVADKTKVTIHEVALGRK